MRKPPPPGAKPSNTSCSTPLARASCSSGLALDRRRGRHLRAGQGWRGAAAAAAATDRAAIVLVFLGFVMKAAMLPVRIDYQMHPALAPTPVSGYISAVLLKSGPWGVLKLFVLFGGAALFGKLGGQVHGQPLLLVRHLHHRRRHHPLRRRDGGHPERHQAAAHLFHGVPARLRADGGFVRHFARRRRRPHALRQPHDAEGHALPRRRRGDGCRATQRCSTSSAGSAAACPSPSASSCSAGLSLAGVPPLNGFSSKWVIFMAAFQSGHWLLGAAAMIGSLFTLGGHDEVRARGVHGHADAPRRSPPRKRRSPC